MSAPCPETSAPAVYRELIWDADGQCTVQAGEVALTAGEPDAWTPELLVAAGIAAAVMRPCRRATARSTGGISATVFDECRSTDG
jgi:hypothetical protein